MTEGLERDSVGMIELLLFDLYVGWLLQIAFNQPLSHSNSQPAPKTPESNLILFLFPPLADLLHKHNVEIHPFSPMMKIKESEIRLSSLFSDSQRTNKIYFHDFFRFR